MSAGGGEPPTQPALRREVGSRTAADSPSTRAAELDSVDGDLGSGGPVLAGGDASGPRRLIFASKAGTIYVLDPGRLGGFHAGSDAGAVQVFKSSDGEYGAPAYWNGHVYLQGSDVPLRDDALSVGRLSAKPVESKTSMPSEEVPARDRAGTALRFNIPTVANGRVYVGTRGGVDVHGLLN